MNTKDFHEIIRAGKSGHFTILTNNEKFENQKLIILSNDDYTFSIHSALFSKSLSNNCWKMNGDPNNITLTNIYNGEIIHFKREH